MDTNYVICVSSQIMWIFFFLMHLRNGSGQHEQSNSPYCLHQCTIICSSIPLMMHTFSMFDPKCCEPFVDVKLLEP